MGGWKREIVVTHSSWPGPGEGSGNRRKQALLGFPLSPLIPAVPEAAMGVSLRMGKQKLIPSMIQSTRANPAPAKHPPPKWCSSWAGSLLPVNRGLPRTISHPVGLLWRKPLPVAVPTLESWCCFLNLPWKSPQAGDVPGACQKQGKEPLAPGLPSTLRC